MIKLVPKTDKYPTYKKKEELELTDDMISRNDGIDNAVYDCICVLTEQQLEWDMSIIADVTDSIKDTLSEHNLSVRHPGIMINDDGTQEYDE